MFTGMVYFSKLLPYLVLDQLRFVDVGSSWQVFLANEMSEY